jgi:hypothetical protein
VNVLVGDNLDGIIMVSESGMEAMVDSGGWGHRCDNRLVQPHRVIRLGSTLVAHYECGACGLAWECRFPSYLA